jgi:insertion element IS1 protein InsB
MFLAVGAKDILQIIRVAVRFQCRLLVYRQLQCLWQLPDEKHIKGKLYTQRIERENLNIRNRLKRLNRKTLGYSR